MYKVIELVQYTLVFFLGPRPASRVCSTLNHTGSDRKLDEGLGTV